MTKEIIVVKHVSKKGKIYKRRKAARHVAHPLPSK